MPALRTYKIFISHSWKYSDEYWRLVSLLHDAPNFTWENLSVPENHPIHDSRELEYELNNRLRPASVFLVLAGMYCAHSDWIDYEIHFARRIGRPIIGIQPWGSLVTPVAVQNAAREVVGWNTASIVSAIRYHALPEEK